MKLKKLRLMTLVLALTLAPLPGRPIVRANIYTVTSTDNSGFGTLRQAIINANHSLGSDIIEFDIPWSGNHCSWSSGVCTIQPTSPLPTLTGGGTTIDGYTQPDAAMATGTTPAAVKIVIDGRDAGTSWVDGLTITSGNNVIKGLVICTFSGDGVEISGDDATDNTISGNYIGTDAEGGVNGNGLDGVCICNGAQNNTIGGATAAERNVISFNDGDGISIYGNGNTVCGNYVGTDASGTTDLGNIGSGVSIGGGDRNNTIGGATSGERNVISGNDRHGIHIFGSNNTVSGNYIGTDASGTADLGNAEQGIHVAGGGDNNTIGGTTPGERNVISGNDWDGVGMSGSTVENNTVCGNYIGTDASGTADLGNAQAGIDLGSGAKYNTVGPGNLIAYNSEDGVQVGAISNTITRNSIFSNTLGIVTSGANGGIGAPVIFTTTLGSVNIVGSACSNCTVELFENSDTDGEGESYVGDTTADAGGAFTVTVDFLNNPYLTATATDAISGTSEFSAVFTTTVSGAPPAEPICLPIVLRNAS